MAEMSDNTRKHVTSIDAARDLAHETELHATCIAVDGSGVVLTGDSGSGKSALGLQLIVGGGQLVADDVTAIYRDGPRLIARAPVHGAGMIESWGNGILRVPFVGHAPVSFFVELVNALSGRLPEPAYRTELDVAVPLLRVEARHPTSAALIRLAVSRGAPHIPDTL